MPGRSIHRRGRSIYPALGFRFLARDAIAGLDEFIACLAKPDVVAIEREDVKCIAINRGEWNHERPGRWRRVYAWHGTVIATVVYKTAR